MDLSDMFTVLKGSEKRNMSSLKVNDIKIGDRFRIDLGDLKALKQSIQEFGLFHPIVVNENNELICGQRRLEALKQLGYEVVPTTRINIQDIVNGEIHENTVSDILKRKSEYLSINPENPISHNKRLRKGKYSGLEDALILWTTQMLKANLTITGSVLQS